MPANTTKTRTLYVKGMHCQACELLINEEFKTVPGVTRVKASLRDESVEVEGVFGDQTDEEIAELLSKPIAPQGYTVSLDKPKLKNNWSEFKLALPLALGFLGIFVWLQKIGLVNLVSGDDLSYGAVLLVGVIASLSSCMAVVGGLLLSLSATYARAGRKVLPHILFHGGRLGSFFVLGGVIGVLGTAFTLSSSATFVLGLLIGLVMLILGINLLDIFSGLKRFQFSVPPQISRQVILVTRLNHSLTPLLVGVVTFFLPCGFTQSMQLYTLSTGGFLAGGLTMFVFALGTLPVLALLSVGSFRISRGPSAGVFYKTAGLIVIAFALMNIINSFVVMGYLSPVFTF